MPLQLLRMRTPSLSHLQDRGREIERRIGLLVDHPSKIELSSGVSSGFQITVWKAGQDQM